MKIDIKKGAEFDMVEDPMYASLLRLSLDDTIEAVVCGPNCRTRSVLRHFPIPDQPDAQKPVRGWGGEERVLRSNSDEERKKVEDDDLMLWIAITVSLISIHNRRAAQPEAPEPKFLIEQPSSPKRLWRFGGRRNGEGCVRFMGGRKPTSIRGIGEGRHRSRRLLEEA